VHQLNLQPNCSAQPKAGCALLSSATSSTTSPPQTNHYYNPYPRNHNYIQNNNNKGFGLKLAALPGSAGSLKRNQKQQQHHLHQVHHY